MKYKRKKWEPGWNGCATPYDYGWYRAVKEMQFLPDDVWFTNEEFEQYRQGYNDAKDGW